MSEPAVQIIGLPQLPEVRPGDDLVGMIGDAVEASDLGLRDGDVLVVTQKVVSKAEGRLVDLRTIEPSAFARDFAEQWNKDPRQVEVVLRESKRIVRMDRGVLISETRHGFVCANAGVDASNVEAETVCLLPLDPGAFQLRAAFFHLVVANESLAEQIAGTGIAGILLQDLAAMLDHLAELLALHLQ